MRNEISFTENFRYNSFMTWKQFNSATNAIKVFITRTIKRREKRIKSGQNESRMHLCNLNDAEENIFPDSLWLSKECFFSFRVFIVRRVYELVNSLSHLKSIISSSSIDRLRINNFSEFYGGGDYTLYFFYHFQVVKLSKLFETML